MTTATSARYATAGTVIGLPPKNTALPVISGTAKQGQALIATRGSWNNYPTSYAYQWQRCNGSGCANISGATKNYHVLVYADAAHTIRIVVKATDAYGSTAATSNRYPATGTVIGLPPKNTALPTISGTAKQGQKLTASKGSWTNSPTAYTYQWRRCNSSGAACANISGATASSYTLVYADAAHTIRIVVTAKNAYGSTSAISGPTAVVALAPAVSAGYYHTCALLSNHTVKCWGWNGYGALGNGKTTNSSTPVQVSGITNATQVGAGSGYTCALLSSGTVKCWGAGFSGVLGNGKTTESNTPVSVSGITTATQISAGVSHTCALLSNHRVECWGANDYGELGNGTAGSGNYSANPVQVSGITTATQVSAGSFQTCALLSGGTVKCWGDNEYGQLGNRFPITISGNPVQVSGITTATEISSGGAFTCALLSNHSVECWGSNWINQLGYGGTGGYSWAPVSVYGISNATQVSAGGYHTCALLSSGTVKCWGRGDSGQLGNGTRNGSPTPVAVKGITNAIQVSAGGNHTCAVLSSGTVKCWGANDRGELGNGTTTVSSTPVSVVGLG